jgi:hypothetical protein
MIKNENKVQKINRKLTTDAIGCGKKRIVKKNVSQSDTVNGAKIRKKRGAKN